MTTSPSQAPSGAATVRELLTALRRWVGDPGLEVDDVTCRPLPHDVSAPTTRRLTRVRLEGRGGSGQPVVLRLVAKELQSARYGLPPQMPDDARAHLDALIPWRLEADVLVSGVAGPAAQGEQQGAGGRAAGQ